MEFWLHTMKDNYEYKPDWVNEIHVNEWSVITYAKQFENPPSKAFYKLESLLLLKALTFVDLATLFGDDTISNVSAVINKALRPLEADLVEKILNSIACLIEKVKSIKVGEEYSLKVRFDKTNGQKYLVKISGKATSNDPDFKDLTLEDFLELKELLTALDFLNGDVHERLTEFLCLKNDITGYEKPCKKTVRVASICVYPAFVRNIHDNLQNRGLNKDSDRNDAGTKNHCSSDSTNGDFLPIAAVAAGFPSGLYDLESKKREISFAIESGANEIDIVISRYLVLGNYWQELYNEIRDLKKTCDKAIIKTILSVGECGSLDNVYKASMVALMAGTDYIKTSTGKETVNATFTTGVVMCRAIKNFYMKTGIKAGFKPAGGIKTADDALQWIKLIMTELGPEWLSLFRIGASSVVDNIAFRLKELHC